MNEAEVQRSEKVRLALEIIAGVREAYSHWEIFCKDIPKPEREPDESMLHLHYRMNYEIKKAACLWLSEKI